MSRRKNPSEEDFGDLLRDGLSSHRSYVVLKQKTRSPVYLCFKPFIYRLNSRVLYLGGKLSIFPDTSHPKWGGNQEEKQHMLVSGWRKLPKDRVSHKRIGSNAGFYVAAARGDGDKFIVKFDKGHMIHTLLDAIEGELAVEISNRNEVVAFLSMAYRAQIPGFFALGSNDWLADRIVGKKTECLFGQAYVYGHGKEFSTFMEQYHLTPKETETEDENEDEAA